MPFEPDAAQPPVKPDACPDRDDQPTVLDAAPLPGVPCDPLQPGSELATHPETQTPARRLFPSADDDPQATKPIRLGAKGLGDVTDDFPVEEAERIPTNEWRFDAAGADTGSEGEDSHVIGGRYRIVEGIAMGGMGAVFKVRHLGLGRVFALKIIHQALSFDSQMMKFFSREAQVLSRLDHPGIVQITDFGHDDRFGAYLVMECLTGETLHRRLGRETRLSLGPALEVGLQVAEALEHMHGAELIHCDIKPENIFLVDQPPGGRGELVAKIIDFGLSKSMASGATLNTSEMGGTPIYAAPEQLAGKAPQSSMDIYSMGLMLYHLLSGTTPFRGTTSEICSLKISQQAPPLSGRLDAPIDGALEALVMKALERVPEHRQASMSELVGELRAVRSRLHPGPEGSGLPSRSAEVPGVRALSPLMEGVACDLCPAPIFFTDEECRLTSMNPAFGRLLREHVAALVGRPLSQTRLGNIWEEADDVVRGALEGGRPIQRLISFEGRRGRTGLLVWLVPQGKGRCGGALWGMVVPLLDPGLLQ